jgi:hypothetical protein
MVIRASGAGANDSAAENGVSGRFPTVEIFGGDRFRAIRAARRPSEVDVAR